MGSSCWASSWRPPGARIRRLSRRALAETASGRRCRARARRGRRGRRRSLRARTSWRLGGGGFHPAGGPETAAPVSPDEYEVESTALCPLEGPGDSG
eukprot:11022864-Alexandrium_andersonii.AAC.1